MSDFISRQAALNAIGCEIVGVTQEGRELLDLCQFAIKQLPSAESEQKKGEWIYDGIRGRFPACKCSICGHYENADWALLQGANFCPHCGADMRGDQ